MIDWLSVNTQDRSGSRNSQLNQNKISCFDQEVDSKVDPLTRSFNFYQRYTKDQNEHEMKQFSRLTV